MGAGAQPLFLVRDTSFLFFTGCQIHEMKLLILNWHQIASFRKRCFSPLDLLLKALMIHQ